MTEPSPPPNPSNSPETARPAPPSQSPGGQPPRPVWTWFLTPVAVVLGALIIAGAVWITNDDGGGDDGDTPDDTAVVADSNDTDNDSDAVASGGERPDESENPATSPTEPATQVETVETLFAGYAAEIDMDPGAFVACYNSATTQDSPVVQTINDQLQRGFSIGVNATPSFAINNKFLVGAQPAEIFNEIIEAELSDTPPTTIEGYSPAVQALASDGRFQILDAPVDVEGASILGNPNAKVMVTEFSDFQCPFCQRWEADYGNTLRQRVTSTDDVALAFLHFPIQQIHPNAPFASVAAICAAEDGKFWEMHNLLFNRQDEWADAPR